MSKDLKLNTEQSLSPVVKRRSVVDMLNDGHVGVEFYAETGSTAPMMYFMFDSREEADEAAGPSGKVFVREVGPWKVAP